MSTEAQIHADIETVRANVTETQALYREVCTILFFRYGITPTANKLYQYVRKGSMSAPAEALANFWQELREKSRVRIEHPDMPDAVRLAAGDLVARLWTQAQASAQEGLAVLRTEAQASVLMAQAEKATAEEERAAALNDLHQARQAAQAAAERTLNLERNLAAERAGKEALVTQLEAAGRQQANLEAALAEARRDFATELEKLHQALQRSEERLDASEKRALLEIDRERTAALRVQKELNQIRQAQQQTADHHRIEVGQLQRELSEARQQLGVAEGTLHELRAAHQQQAEQLYELRKTLAERDTQAALVRRDLEASQSQTTVLSEELRKLRAVPPTGEGSRKQGRKRQAAGEVPK